MRGVFHIRGFSLFVLAIVVAGCGDSTAPSPRYTGTFVLTSVAGAALPYQAHLDQNAITVVADTLEITADQQVAPTTIAGNYLRHLTESAAQGGHALGFSGRVFGDLSGNVTFPDPQQPLDQSIESATLNGNTLTARTQLGTTFIYARVR